MRRVALKPRRCIRRALPGSACPEGQDARKEDNVIRHMLSPQSFSIQKAGNGLNSGK